MTDPVRKIVIVGGGTAGWMCAAALSRVLDRRQVEIVLVESDAIGTVGVGEATIPTIRTFNAILGLDETDFLRQTKGTIKLGIQFCDWGQAGDRYLHPFGRHGVDFQALKFHQLWLKAHMTPGLAEEAGALTDYNLAAAAVAAGRFTRPAGGPDSVLATLKYAYHFDAGLYARYLRTYAERGGVVRHEGRIAAADLDPHSGFITGVALDDGRRITGDLFIDCSGFRSLLLGDALKTQFISWSQWLPCDRAVAMPCESPGAAAPFTRATADAAGWRWRIPLQHRVGNGYVYSSGHLTSDAAETRLRAGLDGPALGPAQHLKFTAGRRQTFWSRNCVAIGLAAGFLEPLESTSIHLIQSGIARLLALFPDRSFNPLEIKEYNRQAIEEFECVRDFVILHYKSQNRDDTDFWRGCRDMAIPDSLATKIALFRGRGRVFKNEEDPFPEDSWLAVMLGQGIEPAGYDPLVDSLDLGAVRDYLRHIRSVIARTAGAMPSHESFLRGLSAGVVAQA